MRFQEYLMLQALGLQASAPDFSIHARLVLDDINAPFVYMLIHGDSLAGRALGRPKNQGVKVVGRSARTPKLSLKKAKTA